MTMDQRPTDAPNGITAGGGELRRNPVSGKLVIVAPGRGAPGGGATDRAGSPR